MAKPILNGINAFDITHGTTMSFRHTGAVYGYKICFYNPSNNPEETSLVTSIKGVWNTADIALSPTQLNGLKNETYYNVTIAIYETIDNYSKDICSEESDKQYCKCVTTPTVAIRIDTNTGNEDVIKSSNVVIGITYGQNIDAGLEKEELSEWQVFVYYYSGSLYGKSEVFTDSASVYNVYGLSDDNSYKIELTAKTVNKMVFTKTKTIKVSYESRKSSIALKAEDLHNGIIKVSTKISANLYKIDDESTISFDGVVDLKKNGITYYDGITIGENWSLLLRYKDPNPQSDLLTMSVIYDNDTKCKLTLFYEERYVRNEYDEIDAAQIKMFLVMKIQDKTGTTILETNIVDKPTTNTWYNTIIRKSNGLYKLENKLTT